MSIFKTIKQNLNLIEVARFYGIEVNRSGFTSCLFHNERTSSLKLYNDHFHCYGCGKSGDVIALIARWLNISQFESARILINDFGLSNEKIKFTSFPQIQSRYSENEKQTLKLLHEYLHYLKHISSTYAPKNEDETVNYLFVKSLKDITTIDYYIDLLTFEPLEVRIKFLNEYVEQLDEIEVKLDECKRLYPRRKEF